MARATFKDTTHGIGEIAWGHTGLYRVWLIDLELNTGMIEKFKAGKLNIQMWIQKMCSWENKIKMFQ